MRVTEDHFPAVQLVQKAIPVSPPNVPSGQSVHVSLCDSASEYLPVGHRVH